jgi:hypothetical protein
MVHPHQIYSEWKEMLAVRKKTRQMSSTDAAVPPPHYEPITTEAGPAPIRVLNDMYPLQKRKFHITCDCCEAQLEFMAQHVNRSWGIWPLYAAELSITCPVCDETIVITQMLPAWVRRRLGCKWH